MKLVWTSIWTCVLVSGFCLRGTSAVLSMEAGEGESSVLLVVVVAIVVVYNNCLQ